MKTIVNVSLVTDGAGNEFFSNPATTVVRSRPCCMPLCFCCCGCCNVCLCLPCDLSFCRCGNDICIICC